MYGSVVVPLAMFVKCTRLTHLLSLFTHQAPVDQSRLSQNDPIESDMSSDMHPNLGQVSRVLGELLADHWGEMICQQNSATVSSRYTQLFQVTPLWAQL